MTENNNKGMKSMRKVVIIGGVLAVLNFLAGFLAYPHLPDKVPTHWNFAGEVDGWGTAWEGAFLLPLVYLGIYLLLILVPKIDPKRRNYALMGRAYSIIVLIILLFFSAIYFATLGIALGYFENLPSLINIAIGIMFIVIGNYMGKIKHNYCTQRMDSDHIFDCYVHSASDSNRVFLRYIQAFGTRQALRLDV